MLLPILDLIVVPTQFFMVHLTLSCLNSRDHGTPLLVLSFNPMPPLQLNHCLNNCSGIESQSTAESTPSWLQLLGSLLLNQPTFLCSSLINLVILVSVQLMNGSFMNLPPTLTSVLVLSSALLLPSGTQFHFLSGLHLNFSLIQTQPKNPVLLSPTHVA